MEGGRQAVRSIMKRVAVWLNRATGGRVSPAMVTVVGVAMHLPIAFLIAADNLLLAGLLLIIFGPFDALDGELARLQGKASEAGMLLDASTDRLKEVMLYSGIVYWISVGEHPEWATLAVIACGASLTVSYVKAKGETALAAKAQGMGHHQLNTHFKQGLLPFEIRMLILVIGLLSGQILVATGLIAVLATYTVFERLVYIIRKL